MAYRKTLPRSEAYYERFYAQRLKLVQAEVPALSQYTGKPCVYVRWVPLLNAFYSGRSKRLHWRYQHLEQLQEVIYFKENDSNEQTFKEEALLVADFVYAGLLLVNKTFLEEPHFRPA